MPAQRVFGSGITALAFVLVAPSTMRGQTPLIQVGPNVHVSKDLAREPHYEYLAGAHATDPRKMLACSYVFRSTQRADDTTQAASYLVLYATEDGGKTWKETMRSLDGDGDPVCTYGLGDTAYFVTLSGRVPFRRSTPRDARPPSRSTARPTADARLFSRPPSARRSIPRGSWVWATPSCYPTARS
jgi:hypothetical protein